MVSKRDQDEKEEEKGAEGRVRAAGLGREEFRSSSATIRATISARKALRHYILGVQN